MRIRDLIATLSTLNPNMEVRFVDTYERSEGWADDSDNATCAIRAIHVINNNYVELDCMEDYYEED